MLILKPLAQRPLAFLWVGQVLAATGSEFYMVAVVWIAADFIGRDAGYVAALQSAALLFGSLFGGILTDRWRFGSTLIGSDLVRALLMFSLSIAGLMQWMNLPLLIVVAGAAALVSAASFPALQALLPAIATDPELRHATNGLFDATKRMARILGPSLIAVVNNVLPKTQFFTVTGVTFLLSALAVRVAIRPLKLGRPYRDSTGVVAALDSVFGGFRAVRSHAVVVYGLATSVIGNAAWAMGLTLGMILYLRQTSDDPLTDYSLMLMAYGVGNVGATVVLASIRPDRPLIWLITSKLIFGLGVILLPLAPDRYWLMLASAFAATNGPFENLAMLHLMQTRFQLHRLAQVYRLQMCAIFSGLLLAYLIAPTLFGWFGLVPVIIASGAATFATGVLGIGLIGLRRYRAARVGVV